jgi:hypothetical protein
MKVKNECYRIFLYMARNKFECIITSSIGFRKFLNFFTKFNTNMYRFELIMVTKWYL